MLKKVTIFTLILTIVFSTFGFVSAGSPDYTEAPSASEVSCGEKVTFDITAPSSVQGIKVYKSFSCKADEASFAYKNKKSVATPLPPVTEKPIILDCDRAVLLGTPSNGVKLKKSGFNMGTSQDSLSINVKSNDLVRGKMNKLVTGLSPETTYYYQAYVVTSKGTFKGDVVSFTTPAKKEWTPEEVASITNIEDRYNFLFGTDTRFYKWNSKPFGFATKAEAQMQTVTFDVPVWKLNGGNKVSGTMSLTVNYKLEESVKAIFQDIYNLDIKFPIISLRGYWYRRATGPGVTGKGMMSHHSFGSAIDVNKKYNLFYSNSDKRDKNSPYYTPKAVIDVFAKYGWSWGGNFAEGYDTMHFQYLGLDLLGK